MSGRTMWGRVEDVAWYWFTTTTTRVFAGYTVAE
jgi:hypothetical protein